MAISKFQEQEISQLAKDQLADFESLALHTLLADDAELKTQLHDSATAVVNSIAEGFHPFRSEEFQKNFLVIAKAFNVECRTFLHHCLEQEYINIEKHNEFYQRNRTIETKIIAIIKELQQTDHKGQSKEEVSS